MATGYTPDIGISSVAAAQYLLQQKIIVGAGSVWQFGTSNTNPAQMRTFSNVRGLPYIRIGLLLYPEYDRGDFTFPARNYLQWRVVGTIPSSTVDAYTNFVNDLIPLTTPQILPVGQPISIVIPSGGCYSIAVEIDASAGAALPDQGRDLVYVSISAST